LTHPFAERQNCTDCHGAQAAILLPKSHDKRIVATCTVCHEKAIDAPFAPHTISDRASCLSCHSSKLLKPLPASHAKRNADVMCGMCHLPAKSLPTDIPHTLQNRQDCVACHGAKGKAPEIRHTLKYRQDCTMCHRVKG
jgi:hypothetical protein